MSLTDVLIRRAEPPDVAQLYVLLQGKAEFDGALAALSASEADIKNVLSSASPACEFAVATLNSILVGFASYYPVFSTYAARPGLWMDDLFVDAEYRGRGIGKDLLKFVADEACKRNCCKLEWSLAKSNVRGIAFYEREGAVVREHNRFAKLDERAMKRLLPL